MRRMRGAMALSVYLLLFPALDIGIDLYNLFNANYATGFDQSYDYGVADGGEWLQPTGIVSPRFARFNLTLSF
jgi:hypothetical protein